MTELQRAEGLIAERKAVSAERSRALAIVAAAKRFAVSEPAVQEAILGDVTAAEFARHAEVEFLAAQICHA